MYSWADFDIERNPYGETMCYKSDDMQCIKKERWWYFGVPRALNNSITYKNNDFTARKIKFNLVFKFAVILKFETRLSK